MSAEDSFDELMARLRAGDPVAAERIFRQFARRLIALAQSRLGVRVGRKVDPEDVLQSVFRSFFRRQADHAYDLDNWESLWALLAQFTVRKCGHKVAHFHAARRDVRREENLLPLSPEESTVIWEPLAREPTASEAAVLVETLEQLLAGLEERDRAIVTLSLQGYSVQEIVQQVGRPQRAVYRVLERVKRRLQPDGEHDTEVD
jgi:RNA polymerase sigma-70 factor (ECF subfamily)